MTEPGPEDTSAHKPESEKAEKQDEASAEKAAARENSIRTKRQEVFEEFGHLSGFSDKFSLSNLALVFTVEDDEDEQQAQQATDEGATGSSGAHQAPDKDS